MPPPADRRLDDRRTAIYRHPLVVRATHWINVACILILVMSGLQILRAHPHLYWGLKSTFDQPWLSFPVIPAWLTIPSWQDLASGRHWHFLFAWIFVANGAVYLLYVLFSGRLQRLMTPTKADLADIPHSVVEHAQLRFPEGEAARRYNVLQMLTYLAVLLGLLPLMLATGLSMSPMMNAAAPDLLLLFGGRQSARTLHFLSASGIVLFTAVHVLLVFLSGPLNNLRGMVTGWYVIREPDRGDEA